MTGTCRKCGKAKRLIHCPTGNWWAHEEHPDDGHDAT